MLSNTNIRIRIKLVYGGESLTVFGRELIGIKIFVQQSSPFCERTAGMFYKGLIVFGHGVTFPLYEYYYIALFTGVKLLAYVIPASCAIHITFT